MANKFDDALIRAMARRALFKETQTDNANNRSILVSLSTAALLPTPSPSPIVNALLNYQKLAALPVTPNSVSGLLGLGMPPAAIPRSLNSIAGLFAPERAPAPPVDREPVKRKAFFSFHYDDITRVNNVRQEGKISKRSTDRNFYDRSLWESKKLEGPDALKRLIREGMEGASAVCVLIGTATWTRPWVRYEIARAIVDRRGLFGVHINGLRHHQRREPDAHGISPFDHVGVYKDQEGKYYLCEKNAVNVLSGQWEWQWQRFPGYVSAIPLLPRYLIAPQPGYIMPLSSAVEVYDYCHPQKDLGSWIDRAASLAGY